MAAGGVTRTIVIGGGCSGMLLAVELASRLAGGVREVVVVDPGDSPGPGVAYSTRCASHLLNVPAGQMSARREHPDHFLAWAQDRDPRVSEGSFVPRKVYGEYLKAVWREAQANAPRAMSLVHVRSRVCSLDASRNGERMTVELSNGSRLEADQVALAMGNLPAIRSQDAFAGVDRSPRYVADPWCAEALDGIDGPVLLIGTGLTAIDVAFALHDRGFAAPIHMLSRRGLLPRPHRLDGSVAAPLRGAPSGRTVHSLSAELRRRIAELGDWRCAIDELRPHVAELWRDLPDVERRRFMRHASRFWEVHRHRLPVAASDRVDRMLASGRLTVRAGAVVTYRDTSSGLELVLRRRGPADSGTEVLTVSRVINCTGPQLTVALAGDPFVDRLLASGHVRPGAYGLGFAVDVDGAVIDAKGMRSRMLWAIGPLRRGAEWESTAVREIRAQAVALAARLSPEPSEPTVSRWVADSPYRERQTIGAVP